MPDLAYLPYPATHEGYSVEGVGVYRSNATRGGLPRQRRIASYANRKVKASWTLRAEQYSFFIAFFNHATTNGLPFLVDAIIDGVVDQHEANFVPGSLQQTRVHGGSVSVSATLEVKPKEVNSEADDMLIYLFENYGILGDTMLNALANLANVVMPEELQ